MANVRERTQLEPAARETDGPPAASARPPRRRLRATLIACLSAIGPGVIGAAAGNDARGIATSSTNGVSFDRSLRSIFALIAVGRVLVQGACACNDRSIRREHILGPLANPAAWATVVLVVALLLALVGLTVGQAVSVIPST